MNNEIKLLLLLFSIGFIFFTCKNEPEELPKDDYRDELVGTYVVVCTETQTGPYDPTVTYTTDTTDIGKEIEVTYDPADELNDLDYGFIKIGGGTFIIQPHDLGYSFGAEAGHLGYNSGFFISPDSITHGWNSSPSNSAEYAYQCRGVKIQ